MGLSTVLQGSFGWDPALSQALINIPLLIFGWILLGNQEGFRSLLGSIALPVAIAATRSIHPMTHDPLIGALFGGASLGIALALILSARGSVGGYTLIARVLAKKFGTSIPTTLLVCDGLTILAGAFRFGPEKALLGLVAAYVMRTAIDRVLVGFSRSFMALIISEKHAELQKRLLVDLDRGMTVLSAQGGYTGEDRPVLMIALGAREIPHLRSIVAEDDPNAFVIISSTTEILGHGFVRST